MYMPSAFRPNGDNVFMPVFEYFTGSNYLFQIYNRWGQLIFETNDPNTGWTGQYNGTLVPLGVYAYRLVYSNLQNQSFQQQGTVTVVY
jgi:gliding motility-associated-like protein